MQYAKIGAADEQSGSADTPWWAIYTRHQHEKTVCDLLARKGIEVFLPLYEARRRWKDRIKTLSLPLFPSYVFIRGSMDRQFQVVTTPGVYSVIAYAGRIASIPDFEIEAVRRTINSPQAVEPHPYLKLGDWVRVTRGPLEGIEGILTRTKGLFRLVLSVDLLQKSVAVEVDASDVEHVAPRGAAEGVVGSVTVPPRAGRAAALRTMCSNL